MGHGTVEAGDLIPTRRDAAAPAVGGVLALLDEVLEPFEVALDAALDEAELVAELLDDAVRLEVQPEGDVGGVALRDEADASLMLRLGARAPVDGAVRTLLNDLGGELPLDAGYYAATVRCEGYT